MKTTYSLLLLFAFSNILAQSGFNGFTEIYPLGEDPNLRYMTSYTPQEKIMFEANPIMRYSLYNSFVAGLKDTIRHPQGWYIAFKPQLRLYEGNSKPVKMPSYRILLGTQHLFRFPCKERFAARFWGFSLESGHYSNGQNRSSFSDEYEDESIEGNAIYETITPSTQLSDILNRSSGNFSTNLTEVLVNYRTYKTHRDYVARQMFSYTLGYMLYHNRFIGLFDFGGYTQNDIKLYGRNRFSLAGEFMHELPPTKCRYFRYSLKQTLEYIEKPHESVEKLRAETILTLYPFQGSRAFGFLMSYIYGHDNYNFRFVDHGNQFSIGITWCQFPPVKVKPASD